jgi:hypothetical protein
MVTVHLVLVTIVSIVLVIAVLRSGVAALFCVLVLVIGMLLVLVMFCTSLRECQSSQNQGYRSKKLHDEISYCQVQLRLSPYPIG